MLGFQLLSVIVQVDSYGYGYLLFVKMYLMSCIRYIFIHFFKMGRFLYFIRFRQCNYMLFDLFTFIINQFPRCLARRHEPLHDCWVQDH